MGVLESIAQPVLGPILRPHYDPPMGQSLTALVQAMFASGEKGVLFDLSQASNLYTDSARTTLVAASGDRIGSVTDLSGNGKHASSSGTARPTWNSAGYGTFDALDDYLQTAAIDFSATDAITVIASVRKGQSAAIGMIAELSASSTSNNGSFWLLDGSSSAIAGDFVSFRSRGSSTSANQAALVAPANAVITGAGKISTDLCATRINGVDSATAATDQGTGNYGNYALNIGSRNAASLFFNGRIYRLLVIGRALTTAERAIAERWAGQPAGIIL